MKTAHCRARRLQQSLSTAFAAAGHPAVRPNRWRVLCPSATCGQRTTDTAESTDGTDSVPSSLQCFSGARGHGGLSTAGTGNTRCRAMRLQRRLSTAFAAAGHPAPRPNSPARICQMPGPLGEIPVVCHIGFEEGHYD